MRVIRYANAGEEKQLCRSSQCPTFLNKVGYSTDGDHWISKRMSTHICWRRERMRDQTQGLSRVQSPETGQTGIHTVLLAVTGCVKPYVWSQS